MSVLETNDYEELIKIINLIRQIDIESTSPEGNPLAIQDEVGWLVDLVVNRKVHCAEPYRLTISSPFADAVLEFSFSTNLYLKSDVEVSEEFED